MSDVKKTSTAQAPFDNPDSDIILRSSDGVNFHVFKLILSLASPVFKDMFTLPQPQPDASSVHTIPMAESSATLNSLLLFCYPTPNPTFCSLDDAIAVLEAARKYDMAGTLSCASDLVVAQFVSTSSLELYALSCKLGWKHHAQTAATEALKIKNLGRPSIPFAGMRDITAFDHNRLLSYHYQCGVASQALVRSLHWLEPSNTLKDMTMWNCPSRPGFIPYHISNLGTRCIARWFEEYLVLIGKELFERPCKSTLYDSEPYDSAVGKAVAGSICPTTVIKDMAKFRDLFAAEVEKTITNVSLLDIDCRFEVHLTFTAEVGG